MKLAHVIVTMFCIRRRGMFKHVGGPPWSEIDPLRRRYVSLRLKLLKAICLPSLLAQSRRDFTWILLVDRDLDAVFREEIERAVYPPSGGKRRPVPRIHLHDYSPGDGYGMEKLGWLEPYLVGRPDWVVTTLCDSDDALPRRFVETVRARVDGLAVQSALPPFQIMGMERRVFWDMMFSRDAPFGWTHDSRRSWIASCGFSLLAPRSCDISVMGMRHTLAKEYFENTPGNMHLEHLDLYRRWFREALGQQAWASLQPEDVFFDVSAAGGALTSNHGANYVSKRLGAGRDVGSVRSVFQGAGLGYRKVAGAETFPDFAIDWETIRRHAADFSRWRVALRLFDRKLVRRV